MKTTPHPYMRNTLEIHSRPFIKTQIFLSSHLLHPITIFCFLPVVSKQSRWTTLTWVKKISKMKNIQKKTRLMINLWSKPMSVKNKKSAWCRPSYLIWQKVHAMKRKSLLAKESESENLLLCWIYAPSYVIWPKVRAMKRIICRIMKEFFAAILLRILFQSLHRLIYRKLLQQLNKVPLQSFKPALQGFKPALQGFKPTLPPLQGFLPPLPPLLPPCFSAGWRSSRKQSRVSFYEPSYLTTTDSRCCSGWTPPC